VTQVSASVLTPPSTVPSSAAVMPPGGRSCTPRSSLPPSSRQLYCFCEFTALISRLQPPWLSPVGMPECALRHCAACLYCRQLCGSVSVSSVSVLRYVVPFAFSSWASVVRSCALELLQTESPAFHLSCEIYNC
jgi:hypothetical protein